MNETLQAGRLRVILGELHEGAGIGEGDDASRPNARLKRAGAAFHGERALGDDHLRVPDGSDADGDGFTHLGFEGGDGGVLLAVALGGGGGFVDGGDGGRMKSSSSSSKEATGAVTMRGAVRLCLTRSVRLEAIWERGRKARKRPSKMRRMRPPRFATSTRPLTGSPLSSARVSALRASAFLESPPEDFFSAVILFLCGGRRAALGGGADAPRRRTRREARSTRREDAFLSGTRAARGGARGTPASPPSGIARESRPSSRIAVRAESRAWVAPGEGYAAPPQRRGPLIDPRSLFRQSAERRSFGRSSWRHVIDAPRTRALARLFSLRKSVI